MTNKDVIRDMYAAFGRGDLPAVLERLDPDAEWHIPGHNLMNGTYRGREAIGAFLEKINELTNGSLQLVVEDIAESEHDKVFVLGLITGERNGKTASYEVGNVWYMKDGRVKEMRQFSEDERAVDAFWS